MIRRTRTPRISIRGLDVEFGDDGEDGSDAALDSSGFPLLAATLAMEFPSRTMCIPKIRREAISGVKCLNIIMLDWPDSSKAQFAISFIFALRHPQTPPATPSRSSQSPRSLSR